MFGQNHGMMRCKTRDLEANIFSEIRQIAQRCLHIAYFKCSNNNIPPLRNCRDLKIDFLISVLDLLHGFSRVFEGWAQLEYKAFLHFDHLFRCRQARVRQ